jgi:hypothetical protein
MIMPSFLSISELVQNLKRVAQKHVQTRPHLYAKQRGNSKGFCYFYDG